MPSVIRKPGRHEQPIFAASRHEVRDFFEDCDD